MKLWRGIRRFFGFGEPEEEVEEEEFVEDVAPLSSRCVFGEGLSIKGEISGEGNIRLMGRFEGTVTVNGDVYIGQRAEVDGKISATSIAVAGRVRGDLEAVEAVEILGGGMLTGNFKSGSCSVADGAVVRGEVWVERSGTRISPSAPTPLRA